MKTSLQYFSTRRLPAWQGELEFLQQSLAHEPNAAQAWWWKLRLRVLTFVIKRYGADPAVRDRDHAPAPREANGNLMFGERRTVEPRPRAALGAHLESIAKENDFPRPPAPPDEDDYGRQRQQNEIQLTIGVAIVVISTTAMTVCLAIEAGHWILAATLGVLVSAVGLMIFSDSLSKWMGRWGRRK